MAKANRKRPMPEITGIDATPERMAKGDAVIVEALRTGQERMTKARRLRPPIDILRDDHKLDDRRHAMLAWYAEQVAIGERSPLKDSLNQDRYGGDAEPSAAIVSALMNVGRIERDLGSLLEITRAVAVHEITLGQWCINKHGCRERYDGKGRFICLVPIAEKRVLETALQDLRMAADRIVK